MMMDRDKISFWTRIGAFALVLLFLATFLFAGLGTGLNINFLQAFRGNQNQQQPQQAQTVSVQDQIRAAKSYVDQHPKDAGAIFQLGYLYAQNGQPQKAEEVLKKGREVAPKNVRIAILLGNVYAQEAQSASGKKQKELYGKAGDAFAAAAKLDPKNAQIYLVTGQAYEQADQPGLAVKYWNKYLKLNPKGKQADQVRKRISQLLKGGSTGG